MLQYVAVYCRVLRYVAVRRSIVVCCSVLQCVAVYCSSLQCVAVRCSALQCVAVRCSALQCVAVHESSDARKLEQSQVGFAKTFDLLRLLHRSCRSLKNMHYIDTTTNYHGIMTIQNWIIRIILHH